MQCCQFMTKNSDIFAAIMKICHALIAGIIIEKNITKP